LCRPPNFVSYTVCEAQCMDFDCLIIGGGPAGLSAATYLARYRRRVVICDAGKSRAAAIPKSHNYPGFESGISGSDLLARLRDQAFQYDVGHRNGTVESLLRRSGIFVARIGQEDVSATCVLLATGLKDRTPTIPGLAEATLNSVVRYCPVCDGYEALDKRIAIMGPIDDALIGKALFLRTYSKQVTVLALPHEVSPENKSVLDSAGVDIAKAAPRSVQLERRGLTVVLENDDVAHFDVLYPALGCDVRSQLAVAAGARCNATGCVVVDEKQRTTVERLYAAGDVVSDLHQLSVAMGHAAIASTAIHHALLRNFR
jgi:thioredoxin reductase (NADPH)